MNVVDSSAWIEYFADGPNAGLFAEPIEATATLVVPSLTLYEVFKRVYRERGESEALQKAAHMMQGRVVDLTASLALDATCPPRLSRHPAPGGNRGVRDWRPTRGYGPSGNLRVSRSRRRRRV